MPAPTLVSYTETTWSGTGTKSTAAVTWLAGDLVVVAAVNESANGTIAAPTATGLTFTAGGAVGTAGSDCQANSWSVTAGAGGSQVVTSTGSGAFNWGMGVWVWRGSGGIGTRATSITAAKTVSLVRSGANSCVVFASGDFSTAATTGYSFTPTVAHDRQHAAQGTAYSVYVADFGDQGSAGTTSYGTAGETSSGPFTNLALEILGVAAAAGATPAPLVVPQAAVMQAANW